jgi:hypothetical protein
VLIGGDPGQTVNLKIGIGGPGCCPTDFTITDAKSCLAMHQANEKCILQMQFTPSQAANEDATLQIVAIDSQGGQVVTSIALSGTGTGGLG